MSILFLVRFEALHGGISVSFWFAVTSCVYLNYREAEVQASEKNLIAQLVSRLSLSEIMVQGRTNVGQLVSQLSLSETYMYMVQGEPRGPHGFCSTFRLAYSNLRQENVC